MQRSGAGVISIDFLIGWYSTWYRAVHCTQAGAGELESKFAWQPDDGRSDAVAAAWLLSYRGITTSVKFAIHLLGNGNCCEKYKELIGTV